MDNDRHQVMAIPHMTLKVRIAKKKTATHVICYIQKKPCDVPIEWSEAGPVWNVGVCPLCRTQFMLSRTVFLHPHILFTWPSKLQVVPKNNR